MELLTWLSLESASVSSHSGAEDLLFILYVIVSIFIKKSRYLLAFSFSMVLVVCSAFDDLQEYQIYLTYFIVYSYIATQDIDKKTKIACGIMCLLDFVLAYDAVFYGVDGIHGERQTLIYQSIEYLAFYANLIIILSLVPLSRIYNSICRLLDHAFSVKADSSYMLVFWYNTCKIQTIK